jgi:hypothetical protein
MSFEIVRLRHYNVFVDLVLSNDICDLKCFLAEELGWIVCTRCGTDGDSCNARSFKTEWRILAE